VLGHDHVSDNHELIAPPHLLKNREKQFAPRPAAAGGIEKSLLHQAFSGQL
jgi:hypothetical protein